MDLCVCRTGMSISLLWDVSCVSKQEYGDEWMAITCGRGRSELLSLKDTAGGQTKSEAEDEEFRRVAAG